MKDNLEGLRWLAAQGGTWRKERLAGPLHVIAQIGDVSRSGLTTDPPTEESIQETLNDAIAELKALLDP